MQKSPLPGKPIRGSKVSNKALHFLTTWCHRLHSNLAITTHLTLWWANQSSSIRSFSSLPLNSRAPSRSQACQCRWGEASGSAAPRRCFLPAESRSPPRGRGGRKQSWFNVARGSNTARDTRRKTADRHLMANGEEPEFFTTTPGRPKAATHLSPRSGRGGHNKSYRWSCWDSNGTLCSRSGATSGSYSHEVSTPLVLLIRSQKCSAVTSTLQNSSGTPTWCCSSLNYYLCVFFAFLLTGHWWQKRKKQPTTFSNSNCINGSLWWLIRSKAKK